MKPNGRPLALFDFDGVIWDSIDSIFLATRELLEEGGVPLTDLPDFSTFLKRISLPSANFFRAYGINWSQTELDKQFLEILSLYAPLDDAYLGMASVIERLRRRGLATAIVSGASSAYINCRLDGSGWCGLFNAVYAGVENKTEALSACCRQFGARAAETCFVGDFKSDMRAGRGAGVRPIGFTGGCDFMIPVLKAAGAEVCVDEPEELLEVIPGR